MAENRASPPPALDAYLVMTKPVTVGWAVLALACVPGLSAPATLGAQAPFPPGITPEVVSAADPSQSYAVFVPTGYRPDTRWPIVLVMDYRGRALVPLERMAPAAERLGYILMSSYHTTSDTPFDPNDRAVDAMIADAQELFSVDARRLYFAGFSGTARKSWELAQRFAPYTAGIIGLGAGLPSPAHLVTTTLTEPIRFAYFGGAGDTDFNYEELRTLDRALEEYGVEHYTDFYPGLHEWPDSAVLTHALEWMDVQAVRRGLHSRSGAELQELFAHGLERGARLEAAGDPDGAARLYENLTREFDRLLDTGEAWSRFNALAGSEAVLEARRRLERQLAERRAFDQKLLEWLNLVRTGSSVDDVGRARTLLDVGSLERRAADLDDPDDAKAARRMLEQLFVLASFYLPSEFTDLENFEMVRAFYDLADGIKPGDGGVCLGRARASAALAAIDEAVDALDCALRAGAVTRDAVERDPRLEPLRSDARYQALMQR